MHDAVTKSWRVLNDHQQLALAAAHAQIQNHEAGRDRWRARELNGRCPAVMLQKHTNQGGTDQRTKKCKLRILKK